MTKVETLSRILFEFSYRDAMLGIPFKPRAYQLASESVSAFGKEVESAWRSGGAREFEKFPGIGKSIAEKIDEFFRTGKIKDYTVMKKAFPVDIWSLSRIEGLGPKHIGELYKYLKVKDIAGLEKALNAHKVRTIPRWGEKSEAKIAHGLAMLKSSSGRHLLGNILPLADSIVARLKKVKGVKRCVYAGSLRRMQETVGDIDLIATSNDANRVMNAFISLPEVESVHEHGTTRSSVRLSIGIDADLRVVSDNVFGATLQYFTGDKRHNVLLRELAISKGYTLNEYGLFTRKKGNKKAGKLITCKNEEDIYDALEMQTPPPELRVGRDELHAAQEHRLPKLIPYSSVTGDLHVHTNWTDGVASIEDMVVAAKKIGLSYIAITDHTKVLAFINGLDESRLAEQGKVINALNKKVANFTILKGTECDILKDGSLDLSDHALSKLDWVGVSVHSHFTLSRAEQTERIIKAISNPNVTCLCHPTARVIGKREEIDIDLNAILAAAKKYHVALEIDASPERSDLRDVYVRAAIKAGVSLVINSDSHSPEQLAFIRLGEAIARRGWAKKADILNTKNIAQLREYLAQKKADRIR